MANVALDGSSASNAVTQLRFGGSKRRHRHDDQDSLDADAEWGRSKLSRQDDGSEGFDLEGLGTVPTETCAGTATHRVGGHKRSRSPLRSPSPSELDSPPLEPAAPAVRVSSVRSAHSKRARRAEQPTALVPVGQGSNEQRMTSLGSRMVLWLDSKGRISAVARDRPLSAAERLKPIVRIPHVDLSEISSINFSSLLERSALVPRHTANTFLRKAASWLAQHLVWGAPERPDPVQSDEFGGSSLTIELLDEDPRSQAGAGGEDEGDVDISGRGTPGSPVTLLGNATSTCALGHDVRPFVGVDLGGLSVAHSAAARPRAAQRLEQAVATRDEPLHDDQEDDIVLGVEIASQDLPVLARALHSHFASGSVAVPASTTSSTRAAGAAHTRPCAQGSAFSPSNPVALPMSVPGLGAGAVRLPGCTPATAHGNGSVGIDSDGDADL